MFEEGDVVSRYTRAQAIEDGVLIDVSKTAKETGFVFPVAVTAGVWNGVLEPDKKDEAAGQSATGRLWDVLAMLRWAIKKQSAALDTIHFDVLVWRRGKTHTVKLKSICGPGDDAAPVLTVLLPDED